MAAQQQTLLDTGRAEDAYACGHDKRTPVDFGGLRIDFETCASVGPTVTLTGIEGEVSLTGEAEIRQAIRALERALGLNARASALTMEAA